MSTKTTPAPTDPNLPSTVPEAWSRVVIATLRPQVDGGQWPAKRARGETVEVTAGAIVDGHETLAVELHVRHEDDDEEKTLRMEAQGNDEYTATFEAERLGTYHYRVTAWIDRFATWQDQFRRRVTGGVEEAELRTELQDGAALVRHAAEHASAEEADLLESFADLFDKGAVETALQNDVAALVRENAPPQNPAKSRTLEIFVDPEEAGFAAWYEFFPRSTRSAGPDGVPEHGTLDDAAEKLPLIKKRGFDIVYLPPIHPVGTAFRKGKDNAPTAEPDDPGSPWAIGGDAGDGTKGGHKSVHPDLGGMEAFEHFVEKADELGLKVALDIAFQTSPDHPYVEEHPEWFYKRPDGSIRYAENPPKKYQDVYPLKFEGEEARGLWTELKDVFAFWIEKGVTIFRVDNPHTKPFAFWQWCLAELREDCPELIVLAEAFTKPKTMYELAKLGFNNSYTYFTWRNTREELEEYGRELFQTDVADFYRPNFWPNTPDILHDYLATGGRPAHIARFVLAATMSPVYGVYGPPFEHVYHHQHPKREEYAGNEKYEIRAWNWDDPGSLQPLMQRVNRIRRENPALKRLRGIRFHETQNPQLIAYTRQARAEDEKEDEPGNLMLVVVNLDPFHAQSGWVGLPLAKLGLPTDRPYQAHDLLQGERYTWHGPHNYVRLDPHVMPAHVFRIEHRHRTEADYDNIVN